MCLAAPLCSQFDPATHTALAPDNALEYTVPSTVATPATAAFVGSFGATFEVLGLPNATSYRVQVQAITDNSKCIERDLLAVSLTAATGASEAPDAPLTLDADILQLGTATLTWPVPVNRGGLPLQPYEVHVQVPNGAWISAGHVTTELAVLYGLMPGTPYAVRVRARNGAGTSAWVEATFTTGIAVPPSSPTGVTATGVTGGAYTLSWLPPLNDGYSSVTKYSVRVQTSTGASEQFEKYVSAVESRTVFTSRDDDAVRIEHVIRDAQAGSSHTIAIIAHNVEGASSVALLVVSLLTATPPTPPTSVTQTAKTGGSVTVQWEPPVDLGGVPIREYVVRFTRDVSTSTGAAPVEEFQVDADSRVLTVAKLQNAKTYQLTIHAVNFADRVGEQAPFSATTALIATAPGKPLDVLIKDRSGGSLLIGWSPPFDLGGFGISYYKLQFAKEGEELVSLLAKVTETEYFLGDLSPLTSYDVTVAAVTAAGEGVFTDRFTASTADPSAPAPPKITGLQLTVPDGGYIQWGNSSDGGAALVGFNVSVTRLANGAIWYYGAGPNDRSVFVDGMIDYDVYWFRIVAVNTAGQSPESAAFEYTHIPSDKKPSVEVGLVTYSSLNVQWATPLPAAGVTYIGFRVSRV